MSINKLNKWAKPIPKLELPPRVQIWELWLTNVELAMSTSNDVAVAFWHQVYRQSEESYQDWRRSSMTEQLAYEKRFLYGRKAPVPAVMLLRHFFDMSFLLVLENLSRLPTTYS